MSHTIPVSLSSRARKPVGYALFAGWFDRWLAGLLAVLSGFSVGIFSVAISAQEISPVQDAHGSDPSHLPVASAPLVGDGSPFVHQVEQQLLLPVVNETPGAAVVIVVDGKVVLQKSYGLREKGKKAPVTPHTLFRVASISKTFASAAGAMLVRESPLDWQSPLKGSVANIHFKRSDYGDKINLEHLLSHSTGLLPHAYTNLIEDNMSYEKILARLDRVDFICEPGDCYAYQNVVFSLIGDVVEAASGLDYPSYVQDRIFSPLRMNRASIGYQAFISDGNHARPHVWNGKDWSSTRITRHYYRLPPAAGVNASIDDMKLWLLAQLGQRPGVMPDEMLDEMHRGVIRISRQQAHYRRRRSLGDIYYGLGWRVFNYRGIDGFVHHGGYVRGMRSEMIFNRSLQTGIVFLTNSEPARLGDLMFDYLDLYLGSSRSGQSVAE